MHFVLFSFLTFFAAFVLFTPFTMTTSYLGNAAFRRQPQRHVSVSDSNMSSTATSSGSTQHQMPLHRFIPHKKKLVQVGPRIQLCKMQCFYCGESGHHMNSCQKKLDDRLISTNKDCTRGYHLPYLHGVWRCENCGCHLMESDVREADPNLYARETAKDRHNWDRFMDLSSMD